MSRPTPPRRPSAPLPTATVLPFVPALVPALVPACVSAFALALVSVVAPAAALAQAVPPPDPPPPDHSIEDLVPALRPATLPEEGLLPSRRHEIVLALPQSFALQHGDLRFRSGIAAEFVPWTFRDQQSIRVGLYGAALLGTWSDGAALGPLGEAGVRARFSLFPDGLVDLYGLLGAGVIGGGDGASRLGLRTSQGLGLRLFRALSTEISADTLFALDGPFRDAASGAQSHHAFGLSTQVGFDLCSLGTFCDHPPVLQERDDRTCCFYSEARQVCESAKEAAVSPVLCASVEAALNTQRHPVLSGEVPFDSFLRAVLSELESRILPSAPAGATPAEATTFTTSDASGAAGASGASAAFAALRQNLKHLQTTHQLISLWRERGRAQERSLAQRRQVIRRKRVYAPYANELLRALGCGWEPGSAGVCRDVCEAPLPTGESCLHATVCALNCPQSTP
ncbi:hypothetical protein [Chondromyces apiculatus]|uniref:Uncharacterized protein n=1 Tax=Chondromyces apiculatus DSM 436 TaxID=1192034 RepID=A0A017TAM3_9BACT|nr:hypothetical protein [Chondromyces apiculatus]EYF06333.1 Hypothetical protein CAP_2211 [Chondromyces apiculatus DSM 436]